MRETEAEFRARLLNERIDRLVERIERLERRGEVVEDWHGKCKTYA